MTPKDAKSVLEQLVHGIDPDTGEVLNAPGVLASPVVREALRLGAEALGASKRRQERKTSELPAAGKAWTHEEDLLLAAGFDQGKTVHEIAREHGRTVGGIAARMVRLGIINERADAYALGLNQPEPRAKGTGREAR